MKSYYKSQAVWIGLAFIIYIVPSLVDGQEDYDGLYEYDDEMSRTYQNRPTTEGRSCRYRRRYGVCRKRSECNRTTRQVCQFGSDPVVCCMDPPRPPTTSTTTTTTTTRAPRRTPAPGRTGGNQNIDLTFPGCGHRVPLVSDNPTSSRSSTSGRSMGSRRGGILSRIGKRDLESQLHQRRVKRFLRGIRPVIVGGTEAAANSWPWMTAMYKQNIPSNAASKRFLCGASLISRQYVITAAHCFNNENDLDPAKYKVVLGAHSTKDGTEYGVRGILLHPDYNKRHYYNDLALLRLERPVQLGKKVYPVCLPSDGLRNKIDPKQTNVTVMGWGDTTFGGKSSQVLLEATMPIVPLKECNASYMSIANTNFPRGITNHFLCAGEKEGGKDACQKDSGGPLVNKLKDNAYVQLGVVSFGFGCGQPGFPGVYTRLSQYTKWIYDNTDLGRT